VNLKLKKFKYTYLDSNTSKRVTAEIMAESLDVVQKKLDGLIIIKIKEVTKLQLKGGNPARYYKYYGPLMHRFGFMLEASLGVVDVIDLIIKEYAKVKPLSKAFIAIKEKISNGDTLSSAFAAFPNIFDIMVISTISIGEETGQLDKMFFKLSTFYERKHKLNSTITKSMIQPGLTLGVCAIAFIFIVKSILPKLLEVFVQVGAKIPKTTQMMLDFSDFLNKYSLLILGIIILLNLLIAKLLKNKKIKYKFDKILMKIPIIGNYLKNINLAIITSNLGILLESGVDLQYSLQLIIEITKNTYIKQMVINSKEKIETGVTMSIAFASEPALFDDVFNTVLKVGETTGQLDIVLSQLAEEYFTIVDNMATKVTTALNFIVLLIITIIVGVMVTAIYGPIQGLSEGLMNMKQ